MKAKSYARGEKVGNLDGSQEKKILQRNKILEIEWGMGVINKVNDTSLLISNIESIKKKIELLQIKYSRKI